MQVQTELTDEWLRTCPSIDAEAGPEAVAAGKELEAFESMYPHYRPATLYITLERITEKISEYFGVSSIAHWPSFDGLINYPMVVTDEKSARTASSMVLNHLIEFGQAGHTVLAFLPHVRHYLQHDGCRVEALNGALWLYVALRDKTIELVVVEKETL